MATPVTTPAGQDPFAGAPGTGTTAPAASPAPSPPGATTAVTGSSVSTMPTFTGGTTSTSKTFGGVPTSQFPASISIPGFHAPGLSPEDQTGPSTIPAYTEGDQWGPASDPNPDNVRQLQAQMIQAGLLTLKSVHLGIWDQTSANAYAKVLAQANLQGVPAATALDNYVASEQATLPSQAINPDDLKAMAMSAGQSVLGRNLNPDELSRFEQAFTTALAQQGSPSTSAGMQQLGSDLLTKENPKGAAANSLHAVSQRALQVLSSPAVSLPGVQ